MMAKTEQDPNPVEKTNQLPFSSTTKSEENKTAYQDKTIY
jgi:hypothetical protein